VAAILGLLLIAGLFLMRSILGQLGRTRRNHAVVRRIADGYLDTQVNVVQVIPQRDGSC
jgi:methyl-accepting chemotaxis protein